MLIDWFTIAAQVLNFVILIWLMKRFLYKPILNAIDAREKLIVAKIADAAHKKTEAQKERDEFAHKNEEFEKQRAILLTKATDDANTERERLLAQARTDAETLNSKHSETRATEAHNLQQALSSRISQEVFVIARKTLTDLAHANLEERMVDAFIRNLRALDDQAKQLFLQTQKATSDPLLLRSAIDLPPEQQTALHNALNETFSAEIHIQFETSPELVSGIELTSNGQKVAWSIKEYLTSMEKSVDELLKESNKLQAPVPTKSLEPELEQKKQ